MSIRKPSQNRRASSSESSSSLYYPSFLSPGSDAAAAAHVKVSAELALSSFSCL
jgi:hypothetical protein